MMELSDYKKAVADTIKDQLLDLCLSRGEFAIMMKVQPSRVTRWLSGEHNFTLETLCAIEIKLKEWREFIKKLNGPVCQVEVTCVLPMSFNSLKLNNNGTNKTRVLSHGSRSNEEG
jgi:hypothetical protein